MRPVPAVVIRPRWRVSPALRSLGTTPREASRAWAECNRVLSSIVATNALDGTGPTPGAVASRAAIGLRAATSAMRSFATTMCALRGAKTAHSGASAVVSAGDRSRSAIRVGTHALALVGPRTPS